jgi:hypothetical protein
LGTFTTKELSLLRGLNTPSKAQNFLNRLRFNFEKNGETLKSPLRVLREGNAHCLEGAIFGAYALSLHGFPPLLMHLKATRDDFDHVVAPFRLRGLWGALSKTNHAVLRYREPIYRDVRELAMSYFHEYFLSDGKKTLRSYSRPLNLNALGKNWAVSREDLWPIDKALDKIKHYPFAPATALGNLRKADRVEIAAGEIVEYKK